MYHIDHNKTDKVKLDLEYKTHHLEVEGCPIVPAMFHILLSVAGFAEQFQFHDEIDIHSGKN